MTREPAYERGALIGHWVSRPPFYMAFRDARGYDSVIQVQPARKVFEPATEQRGIFDEDE